MGHRQPAKAFLAVLAACAMSVVPVMAQARSDEEVISETVPLGPMLRFEVPPGLTTPSRYCLDRTYQSGLRCGPNALFMLLRLCNIDVEYSEVRDAMPLRDNGTSLQQIMETASRFGLQTVARRNVSPEDLKQNVLPVILHVESAPGRIDEKARDHFVVVTHEREGDYFYGIDTTNLTLTRYSVEAMARNMTGYALFVRHPASAEWLCYRAMQFVVIALVLYHLYSLVGQ